jgi:hypothetical protein
VKTSIQSKTTGEFGFGARADGQALSKKFIARK